MEKELVMVDPKPTMWERMCGGMTPHDRRNSTRATWVMAGWGVAFIAATWLVANDVVAGAVAWLVAAVPAAISVAALFAYGRFLREADEMQQKIQLTAFSVGFGVALFFGLGYSIFEKLGAPRGDMADLTFALAIGYLLGLWIARRRYL